MAPKRIAVAEVGSNGGERLGEQSLRRSALSIAEDEGEHKSPFVSVADAAKEIGVSANTVRAWCRQGLIPSYRVSEDHGQVRIHRGELARWLQMGRIELPVPVRQLSDELAEALDGLEIVVTMRRKAR